MQTALIVGCGDVGRRLALRLLAAGERVIGVVRSSGSAARLKALGIPARVRDLDAPGEPLPTKDVTVFYLAPPPEGGAGDPRLGRFLHECASHGLPRRLVYISTSGVYGDCGGALVDETRPPLPQSDRARRRLDAEERLRAWSAERGVPVVILRVPGIYGPGRIPIERLRNGLVVVCPEEAPPSNRIHAEDLARVCIAAAERGRGGEVYNVADGEATSMTAYFYAIADHFGLPRPLCVPLAEAPERMSADMWSFLRESRRLDITKMRRELGVELLYPTLAAGLKALREGDQSLV